MIGNGFGWGQASHILAWIFLVTGFIFFFFSLFSFFFVYFLFFLFFCSFIGFFLLLVYFLFSFFFFFFLFFCLFIFLIFFRYETEISLWSPTSLKNNRFLLHFCFLKSFIPLFFDKNNATITLTFFQSYLFFFFNIYI